MITSTPTRLQVILAANRVDILKIAKRHGAFNVRAFGSVARGEDGPESDLDLLVEFEPQRSLFDHVALMQDLEDLLGIRVDVVSQPALHPLMRTDVLREAIPV